MWNSGPDFCVNKRSAKQQRKRTTKNSGKMTGEQLYQLLTQISRDINVELLGDKRGRTITSTVVDGFAKMGLRNMGASEVHVLMGVLLACLLAGRHPALRMAGMATGALLLSAYVLGRID